MSRLTANFTIKELACPCCGEEVQGLPDIAYDAPYYYHAIPEEERAERARLSADFCSVEPARHIGLAYLPTWDIDAAIAEMHRCREAGLKAINFPPPSRPRSRDAT